ncbi:hypothetical protein HZB02_02875 [Candidatus Woesearchaeota archaeon]|nr:hypothetical protein [Candidatus Woesearchaeota archaeon]
MKKFLEEPEEYLFQAKQELKRIDHLIYVSLKYTRTVDVLRSIIERFINAYDFLADYLLEELKEKDVIKEYPASPGLKCDLIKELFAEDQPLQGIIDFYLLLRRLIRADYTKREEFKRHVTLIANLDGKPFEVDIDKVVVYYKEALEHYAYIEKLFKEEV